jgi:DNA-binding transcriptional LysR family regulator
MPMKKAHGLLGIEMRHLVAFEAVVATGSFARTAEQLGYTQSAVSLQIAALERAAGTRLLERPGGRKPVVPTDAGVRMLRHAARLSAQLQAAEAELTALAEGTANTLRVGTFQSVSIRIVPDAVRELIEERPGIEVRLHEASWDHVLLDLVERGRLDLTFGVVPPDGPFEHVELIRDPYLLLVQAGSPLAERGTVPTLAEIGRLPLIAYSRSTYGSEGVLRSRGIEPNIVFRTDESGAVQRLVAAGIGSAVVARLSIDTSIPGVVALDASRRVPARPIGLVWHRDVALSDAARIFIAAAKARCDELAGELEPA